MIRLNQNSDEFEVINLTRIIGIENVKVRRSQKTWEIIAVFNNNEYREFGLTAGEAAKKIINRINQ